jgi:hypothetical protein
MLIVRITARLFHWLALRADQKVYSTYDMSILRHTMHNNDIQHHRFWDKEALRSPFAGIYTLKPRDFRRPRPRSNCREINGQPQ